MIIKCRFIAFQTLEIKMLIIWIAEYSVVMTNKVVRYLILKLFINQVENVYGKSALKVFTEQRKCCISTGSMYI